MNGVDRLIEPSAEPAENDELMLNACRSLEVDQSCDAFSEVGAVLVRVVLDGYALRLGVLSMWGGMEDG